MGRRVFVIQWILVIVWWLWLIFHFKHREWLSSTYAFTNSLCKIYIFFLILYRRIRKLIFNICLPWWSEGKVICWAEDWRREEDSWVEMLQIRLSRDPSLGSGSGSKPLPVETVTVACPDHLVLADLPVAKSLGSMTAASLVKTVGRRSRRQLGERVHFCVRCDFPIAIYGRLVTTDPDYSDPPLTFSTCVLWTQN